MGPGVGLGVEGSRVQRGEDAEVNASPRPYPNPNPSPSSPLLPLQLTELNGSLLGGLLVASGAIGWLGGRSRSANLTNLQACLWRW